VRDPERRMRGGGAGSRNAGIVYDVGLSVALPRAETVGTAMNALAHCAEALYVNGRSQEGDEAALAGAPLIADALPRVLADPHDRKAREELLRGAMHAGHALGVAGLGLAHAMAQAAGGTYGLPHGAMNALCLPAALEFNRSAVPAEIEQFGAAVGGDAVERARELARSGGFRRLRDFGVPEVDLPALGEAASRRGGNQANPRVAAPGEITELYRSIY
jgi:alcohol dehydrogenase class IV